MPNCAVSTVKTQRLRHGCYKWIYTSKPELCKSSHSQLHRSDHDIALSVIYHVGQHF